MNTVTFSTGNKRKIHEATSVLSEYGISIDIQKLDVNEIQHTDSTEITKAKARTAYQIIKTPVVVSDTSWTIPALGGFPGGYMKDVSMWWKPQDWLAIMSQYDDQRIICSEHIVFYDGQVIQHFVSHYEGTFISEERGRDDEAESIEKVVILYGDKTMAEQLASGEIASAGEELMHWKQFCEWYVHRSKEQTRI